MGHMRRYSLTLLLVSLSSFAAAPSPVFERALPHANLNDSAGAARSNVRWTWYASGFVGDDFRIGNPGERWVIDRIRTWTVPAHSGVDPDALGDFFQDVRLYIGSAEEGLTPLVSGRVERGSSVTDNASIRLTRTTIPYDEFGREYRVWEVEFADLHIEVRGGEAQRFGVWGLGREIPDANGKTYSWFNLASNAALSNSAVAGSDDLLLMFDPAGNFRGSFDSTGKGWNKSSDINIEISARRVADVELRGEAVVIRGSAGLDVQSVDPASLDLSGVNASGLRVADVDHDGFADLVVETRSAGPGVCVSGRSREGIRFAGCAAAR